jgi:hypothetical protein
VTWTPCAGTQEICHDTRSLQAYLRHKNIQHTVRHTELFADAVFTHHYRPLCAKAMTSVRSTLVLRARSISCAGGTPDGSLCSRETAFDLNLRGAKRTLRHTRCTKNGSIPDATEFGRMPKMVRYRLGSVRRAASVAVAAVAFLLASALTDLWHHAQSAIGLLSLSSRAISDNRTNVANLNVDRD